MSFGDDHDATNDLERAARKRWLILMGIVIVVVAIGVPLLTPILDPGEHHKHHSTTTAVVNGAITAAIVITIGLLILRRLLRRDHGFFAAPIAMGLKRAEQRAVGRALRRAAPSGDPRLAGVELSTAYRTLEQSTRTRVLLAIAAIATLAESLTNHTNLGEIYFGCGAAFFLLMLGLQLWNERNARRYLAKVR